MAKARKPKNEEAAAAAKPPENNTEARVRHQNLCLSIDFDSRRIYGYTELEVIVPDIGIVGLHAENLEIESVLVDGEPTAFEYYPHHQNLEIESRWSMVSDPTSAADAAASAYLFALKREDTPNLLVNCCKPSNVLADQLEQTSLENGSHLSGEVKQVVQNIKLVRINYWVDKMESGIHFIGNTVLTDNQIKRARCWFPCIDDEFQRCSFDLEITVPHNFVAVSVGNLLYQVLSKDDPPRKTYVYKLDNPIAARWMSLVAAQFKIVSDQHNPLISNMCLPSDLSKLRNTLEFFHEGFSFYEDYLSAKFPLGSYKQVFLPPEMVVSSSSLGASLTVFSSEVLYDERVIDQSIDTRLKLASALASQWFGVYITPESPNDEWLVDGLAGFLTDMFIKKFLGNNEARYRRYKANCAVCKADDGGATCLSSSASCKDLHRTHRIGTNGKIRSWKSVAVLQMLEKQMGPESFRKILQRIVSRANDQTKSIRTLSTKELRHFANKVGNLERPFLKEFFNRWVASYGCPLLRIGFSYNKRKNTIEMAVLRECTASLDSRSSDFMTNIDLENRDGDVGWPGIMSIRVYELDAMSDHPKLPMAGDTWQLLEIPCHSKLAAKRYQKPKKGPKPDGSDDNVDVVATLENRSNMESPLSWIRADPEIEYLAEIFLHQPVQMWINQLEKDGDVVAQAQAISALEALQQPSFTIVNSLYSVLCDSKVFWRVRVEAAFALAKTALEESDCVGLQHLIKFYKGRRFDPEVGLPKPNDFRDFAEYFVLEVIPNAVAMVRGPDNKSPREAIEFILRILKYNDNSGNPYSDVFWLAALVESIGDLEFSQQSILFLSPLLKRIDRLLQFDRFMPSYNGILMISCIRTLVQLALKLSGLIDLDHVCKLIESFRNSNSLLQVRVEASRGLLDIVFHSKGINAALSLFIKYTEEEPSLRGQVKLCVHAMRLCQITVGSCSDDNVDPPNLVRLLHLLESRIAFNNEYFRHHLFCLFQILAGRSPTLYAVPKDKSLLLGDTETFTEPKHIFTAPIPETGHAKPSQAPIDEGIPSDLANFGPIVKLPEPSTPFVPEVKPPESFSASLAKVQHPETALDVPDQLSHENLTAQDTTKGENAQKEKDVQETASVSVSVDREAKRPTLKIRVRSSAATSRAEGETKTMERSQGGLQHNLYCGATSSVSVDAPQRNSGESLSISNNQHNLEEVNSYHEHGSRMTASIGSAKFAGEGDNKFGKELQCTADSGKTITDPLSDLNPSDSPTIDTDAQKFASLKSLSTGKEKEKENKKRKEKKDKDKKRKRDDPEYLEKKRLKKEKKKQKEREMAKLLSDSGNPSYNKKGQSGIKTETVQTKTNEPSGSRAVPAKETKAEPPSEARPPSIIRIKLKGKTFKNS